MNENSSVLTGSQLSDTITEPLPEMDLASVCNGTGDPGTTGGACDRKGLGISLSTPILMMSTGILGNLIALLILFTTEKQVRRTSFFPLLMAMAVSDLVGQAATGAIAVLVYANNLQWVGGRPVCLYHGFIMVFFAVITPLLVCSMSVERLLALRYSYFYQRCFTHSIAGWVVLGSVIFTLFFCCLPLMGFGHYDHQFPGSWCFLNYHRQSVKDMVYALMFSVLNILIIGFIVVCNVTVVYTLLKMRRLRREMNAVPGIGKRKKSGGMKPAPIRQRSRSALSVEMETQMVWFLLAITVIFSCLWLPLNVHILMNQITGKVDYKQDLISVRLASINQIIDPWMYVIFRKGTFLKVLRRIRSFLTRRKKKKNSSTSMKPSSHSCDEFRLKLLKPDPYRRQSCPPVVGYAVAPTTDRSKDRVLSQAMFPTARCRAAEGVAPGHGGNPSANTTPDTEDNGECDFTKTTEMTEVTENGASVQKVDFAKTREVIDATKNNANVVNEGLTKTHENSDANAATGFMKTKEPLDRKHGGANSLRANFRKTEAISVTIDYGAGAANTGITETNTTSNTAENRVSEAREGFTKTTERPNNPETFTNTNGYLDIVESENKHQNEDKWQMLGSGCVYVHCNTECFLENEVLTCEKEPLNGQKDHDRHLKNRLPSAIADTHNKVPRVDSTDNHVEIQPLDTKSPTNHVAENSTSAYVKTNSSSETDTALDQVSTDFTQSQSEPQFCDVDKPHAPGNSERANSQLDPDYHATDTGDCGTKLLLHKHGCVNQMLQNSMDFSQCSRDVCMKTADDSFVVEDCYASVGEKQLHYIGNVVFHT